ncbi:uncharacterized protein TNCV_4106991 [Trichonephila clavipes]|nr:uncharacterized protein TNCV_4106991 [Trichonephila clavipes]
MKREIWSYRLVALPVGGSRFLATVQHDASQQGKAHFAILLTSTMEDLTRVLNENHSHPFHFQRVRALNPADYPFHPNFCQWVVQQCALQPDITAPVLFTDEVMFKCKGVFKLYTSHVLATKNPHATRPHGYQQRFRVNVWTGIVDDVLISPYILNRPDLVTYVILFSVTGVARTDAECCERHSFPLVISA